MHRTSKGFTLIELLVVIAIIGILASVVMASLGSAREKSRDTQRIAQIREVQKALEVYYSDNGTYPTGILGGAGCTVSSWTTPINILVSGGYLPAVPSDPVNAVGSGAPQYCYNYTVSTAGNSGWNCGGRPRTDYAYAILFSLEGSNSSFPTASPSEFTHCAVGRVVK